MDEGEDEVVWMKLIVVVLDDIPCCCCYCFC